MLDEKALVQAACQARERAYAPYSHFQVGAALLTQGGRVYTGCNIENAAFTPTICAERTALFKAVSEGERSFAALAVVGGPEGQPIRQPAAPCGVCRQALIEFCPPELPILLVRSPEEWQKTTLGELLPLHFGPESLG